ncbi:hypothetical protein FB466_0353 [Klugiella xanthotipulae]|uniref:Uncharacterized protein n=1 Tax=Klugiella xanthotipulae TaxID=244735 RepID=A0A543I4Q7_9MICO|nr:hypothetical protein FB466_0353 [Klugiella xanthotipulae]
MIDEPDGRDVSPGLLFSDDERVKRPNRRAVITVYFTLLVTVGFGLYVLLWVPLDTVIEVTTKGRMWNAPLGVLLACPALLLFWVPRGRNQYKKFGRGNCVCFPS